MSWTDERIDSLRKMWEAGQTASQIAEELGGVSRNAVIGKAHRLGLQSRPSPVKPNEENEDIAAPSAPEPARPAAAAAAAEAAARPHALSRPAAAAAESPPAAASPPPPPQPQIRSIGPGGF